MNETHLIKISIWFNKFVATFHGESPSDQLNYDLKIEHTGRVRAIIDRLAISLDLQPEDRALASAIAICHDVGRFPQFRQYRTFNDLASTNHATLAVQTIDREGILEGLDHVRRILLLKAVTLHNVFTLPRDLDPVLQRFAMLIRDADKLDIWRVLIDYCFSSPEDRASAVLWDLPETGTCSEPALAEVIAGRMLNRSFLKTADDFKLLQLSWAFDLNFSESFAILSERGYLETLAGLLPCQRGCNEAVAAVLAFVHARKLHPG